MEYEKERELIELTEKLRHEYQEVIVDFIIFNEDKRILVQKRSASRHVFPNAWEFPGGHLEPGEDIIGCLKRLVYEEGQLYLKEVVDLVHIFTWDSDKDVVNLQFLVTTNAGTFTPNADKITDHRFLEEKEMRLLLVDGVETQIYRGAFYAFEYLKA